MKVEVTLQQGVGQETRVLAEMRCSVAGDRREFRAATYQLAARVELGIPVGHAADVVVVFVDDLAKIILTPNVGRAERFAEVLRRAADPFARAA